MAAWKGRRSWRQSPYHYDSRYEDRLHLSNMSWQRGLLLDSNDLDTALIGDREQQIIKVFQAPSSEMQADPKLSQPIISDGNDILFVP
jgi:hypothetical protein